MKVSNLSRAFRARSQILGFPKSCKTHLRTSSPHGKDHTLTSAKILCQIPSRSNGTWHSSKLLARNFPTSARMTTGPLGLGTRMASYSSQSDGIAEIDFNPVAANTINIIGNVGRQPEIKYLESGNKVTNFPVAFTDRKDGDTQWFDVEAWDELADIASLYIIKGERVALQGRLKVQDWTDREGNTRKSLRIVAQKIQKVKRNMSMGGYGGETTGPQVGLKEINTQPTNSNYQQTEFDTTPMTSEELWMNFFENTSGWYDNRGKKQNGSINPKSPDFKRIEGGRDAPALWIDSKTTPAWVKTELNKLDMIQGDIPPF